MTAFFAFFMATGVLTGVALVGRGWAHIERHKSYEAWVLASYAGMALFMLCIFILGLLG